MSCPNCNCQACASLRQLPVPNGMYYPGYPGYPGYLGNNFCGGPQHPQTPQFTSQAERTYGQTIPAASLHRDVWERMSEEILASSIRLRDEFLAAIEKALDPHTQRCADLFRLYRTDQAAFYDRPDTTEMMNSYHRDELPSSLRYGYPGAEICFRSALHLDFLPDLTAFVRAYNWAHGTVVDPNRLLERVQDMAPPEDEPLVDPES